MPVSGKVVSVAILGITAVFGIGVYYAQIYGYYDSFSEGSVSLTSIVTGKPEIIPVSDFSGIDANSSPIRYRACFNTRLSIEVLNETFTAVENPEPRNAPNWFECFDANEIGENLKLGTATAYMGEANLEFGIDRIVALYDDGRGFVWHQINECGDKLYDGSQASENCPEKDQ
jgi:hypothetical protein